MLDIEPLSLGEHKGSSEMNCLFCNKLILSILSESRVQRSSLGNTKNVGKFVGKPVGMRFLPTFFLFTKFNYSKLESL